MIHRDVEIVDLDPQTWRNLGQVFPVAEWGEGRAKLPGVLTILHDEGQLLRVDAPAGFDASLVPAQIDEPQALGKALFEAHPGLTRVQIFEKSRLRAFSDAVQRLDWVSLPSDEFYVRAWQIAQADPRGLCYYPSGLPRMRVLDAVRDLIAKTPDGQCLVLGVYEAGAPYFTLIARVNAGEVTLVTTFDALVQDGVDTRTVPASAADAQMVLPLIERRFGWVARSLFCDRAALLELIHASAQE
jgi:hypothetical protein